MTMKYNVSRLQYLQNKNLSVVEHLQSVDGVSRVLSKHKILSASEGFTGIQTIPYFIFLFLD